MTIEGTIDISIIIAEIKNAEWIELKNLVTTEVVMTVEEEEDDDV